MPRLKALESHIPVSKVRSSKHLPIIPGANARLLVHLDVTRIEVRERLGWIVRHGLPKQGTAHESLSADGSVIDNGNDEA